MERSLKLFVNYRRADNPHFVENIRTWLMIRYGRENVFMDFDSLPNFAQFEDFIKQKIRDSDVVISIIGPQWLDLLADRAQRGDKDYVRLELEEALMHRKLIAPICILGADPPPQGQLPEALRPIFDTWNVARLRDGKEIIEKIHRVMDDLEGLLSQQGVQFMVQSQPSELARDNSATAGGIDPSAAYGRLLIAYRQGEWDVAQGWIAELHEIGGNLPADILAEIQELETDVRQKITDLAEQQRRQQVADYLYGFAKARFEAGLLDDRLRAQLQAVWEVLPKYDPADIKAQLPRKRAAPKPKPEMPAPAVEDSPAASDATLLDDENHEPASAPPPPPVEMPPVVRYVPSANIKYPPVPSVVPGPFEWCYVPGGRTEIVQTHKILENGDYAIRLDERWFDVNPFFIGKFVITNAQFEVFAKDRNGYQNAKWWNYSPKSREWFKEYRKLGWPKEPRESGDNLPRSGVSWFEAMAFCRWLSAKTKLKITLPTDVEWNHGVQTSGYYMEQLSEYPWGNARPNHELEAYLRAEKLLPVNFDTVKYLNSYGVSYLMGYIWEYCRTDFKTGLDSTNETVQVVKRKISMPEFGYLYSTDGFRSNGRISYSDVYNGFRIICYP